MKSFLAIAGAALLAAACLEGQTSPLRDPEDGAFDVGGWISTRTGILPIPAPITEPAVGYGGSLTLVLIHGGGIGGMRDAPPGVTGKPVPPDISALAGAGTENGTWAVLGAHQGFWGGDRWRYTGVVGRISPRLDTYDASGNAYFFNLDGWTLYQELRRRVAHTDLFLGARYVFLDTTTRFEAGRLPPDIPRPDFDTRDSGLGAVAEVDTRDNIFTPSSGIQLKASAMFFGTYIGGDHDYRRYTADGFFYWDVSRRLVLASRLRTQSVPGDAPFYTRPFVRLRGIPAMRYQGETAVSLDGEARFGLTPRWWLVAFAGGGWTDAGPIKVLTDQSVHAGGFGFRYLVARILGIQTGIDVARGPEKWAFYVVFGSSW
jgi:hypothetical protein